MNPADQLVASLRERKPINRQIIDDVTKELLSGRVLQDFNKWLEIHETYLIRLING